jgi:hypothetical protein
MFKKFTSMTTAVLLMASGISIVGATTANASPGNAFLSETSTIKGVTVVSLGTPGTNPGNIAARGSIHISTAAAADTSNAGSFITNFVTVNPAATKVYVWKHPFGGNISNSSVYNGTGAVSDGDIFSIYVQSENGLTYRLYAINVQVSANGLGASAPSTPSTPEQIAAAAAAQAAAAAAAARAAEAAAAAIRAAEIATAQTALATVLRGDKAGTLSEYRAANINITTTAALTRLNTEVLKLSAADRADFAKIKAIADKIEFDESFFNATARPSLATYSSYGITGVTERILPVINAKVLELPAALRADVKAMQELVKVESFVDRVANPATRSTVSAAVLVSRGLLTAENPRRHSIVNGLSRYPEGSLNTMAKIEAAIKEQIFIAEAPKRRLAEIKARMAARKK